MTDPIVWRDRYPRADEVVGVVLAAGDSRRMGAPKALLPIGRHTFLEKILALYRGAALPVSVVLGRDEFSITRSIDLHGTLILTNPQPEHGPLSSLWVALEALQTASALIMHPVDHPLVSEGTLCRLASLHRRIPASILIPTHQGLKGHPVLFPQRFFGDLRQTPLSEGARWVVHRNPAATRLVPVEDPGILANLNRPQDLDRWLGPGVLKSPET